MLCPNDNTVMHEVKIASHYDQTITLEQCKQCGGIWFDDRKLYKAKHGEAERIELLNLETLWTPSGTENSKLLCPVDQTELIRFQDQLFPKDIVIEHCPLCRGFWLNREEFTKYQKARQESQLPNEKNVEDKAFQEQIEKILTTHKKGGSLDVLGKLGKFLSTPLDPYSLRPLDSTKRSPGEEQALNITLNVLTAILNTLVGRY